MLFSFFEATNRISTFNANLEGAMIVETKNRLAVNAMLISRAQRSNGASKTNKKMIS
jgi:hypothetical protein